MTKWVDVHTDVGLIKTIHRHTITEMDKYSSRVIEYTVNTENSLKYTERRWIKTSDEGRDIQTTLLEQLYNISNRNIEKAMEIRHTVKHGGRIN